MTKKTHQDQEEEWRKLCELIAHEPDPQRLSKLVDQLIKELDSRTQILQQTTAQPKPSTDER